MKALWNISKVCSVHCKGKVVKVLLISEVKEAIVVNDNLALVCIKCYGTFLKNTPTEITSVT